MYIKLCYFVILVPNFDYNVLKKICVRKNVLRVDITSLDENGKRSDVEYS